MFKANIIKIISISAMTAVLSACRADLVDAPSLNKRAFEISLEEMRSQASEDQNVSDSFLSTGNPPLETILPQLDDDTQSLWHKHKKADDSFARQAPEVQIIVRRANNSPFGGETWANAHVAISRLDQTRSSSLSALSQVDKMVFAILDARLADQAANQPPDQRLNILLQIQKSIGSDVMTQTGFIDNLSNGLAKR